MAVYNAFNFSKGVMRATHATPKTVAIRPPGAIHNSQQRFPNVADVRTGTIYGPAIPEWQEYLTGTMVAGGGSAAYRVIGSPVVRRLR